MTKTLLALLLALSVVVAPTTAVFADHSTEGMEASQSTTAGTDDSEEESSHNDDAQIKQLQVMISLLTQLLDLLKHQAEHKVADGHDSSEGAHSDDDEGDHDDEDEDDHDDSHDDEDEDDSDEDEDNH